MLRAAVAFLILLIASCSACSPGGSGPPAAHPTQSDAIERALLSTITLYTQEGFRVCAGERVSPTEVLTAYHCAVAATLTPKMLEALDAAGVDFNDVDESLVLDKRATFSAYTDVLNKTGAIEPGTFVRVDPVRDLAVMVTGRSTQPYVSVRVQPLPVGAEVFAIGHPAGLDYSYTHGYVSMTCRTLSFSQDACWTQVDITIWGGSSGGGLYDMAGNLVGVASMMRRPGQAFFVYPEYVAKIVHSPVSK
jgi:hypothetical protein